LASENCADDRVVVQFPDEQSRRLAPSLQPSHQPLSSWGPRLLRAEGPMQPAGVEPRPATSTGPPLRSEWQAAFMGTAPAPNGCVLAFWYALGL